MLPLLLIGAQCEDQPQCPSGIYSSDLHDYDLDTTGFEVNGAQWDVVDGSSWTVKGQTDGELIDLYVDSEGGFVGYQGTIRDDCEVIELVLVHGDEKEVLVKWR